MESWRSSGQAEGRAGAKVLQRACVVPPRGPAREPQDPRASEWRRGMGGRSGHMSLLRGLSRGLDKFKGNCGLILGTTATP